MASVSTIILRSMRMIGEKPRGATLDANEQVETLAELNSFMESLSNDKLMVYTVTQDSWYMSTSSLTITFGPGGNISTARPTKLVDPCFTRDSSGYDYPLRVVNLETYGSFRLKGGPTAMPQTIYYDNSYSATSTGTLTIYPPPSNGLTLFVNSIKPLGNFSTLSQQVMFPPGYQLFIESNFAIHLAAGFVDPPAAVVAIAKQSKAALKANNSRELVSKLDSLGVTGLSYDHGIYVDNTYVE